MPVRRPLLALVAAAVAVLWGLRPGVAVADPGAAGSEGSGRSRAPGSPDPRAPSVLLVVTDDQRWDTLWAMPEMLRLAERSVVFSNAFVVNPLCCPSRASLLTGRSSHSTLVYRNEPPYGGFEWFDESSTLATWLRGDGYHTGFFGKYLNGYRQAALSGHVPAGWDRWVAFVQAGYYDYRLNVDGVVRSFGADPSQYSTDVLADEAAGFIRATEGPILAVFAPWAPHAPATPAPRHEGALAGLPPGARRASTRPT